MAILLLSICFYKFNLIIILNINSVRILYVYLYTYIYSYIYIYVLYRILRMMFLTYSETDGKQIYLTMFILLIINILLLMLRERFLIPFKKYIN